LGRRNDEHQRAKAIGVLYYSFIYESTWVLIISNMLPNGHYRPLNGTIAHHKEKTKPVPKRTQGALVL
jgi:hypothetical protein